MYHFTAKKYAQIYYATKIVIFWAKTNWTLSGIQACLNIFFKCNGKIAQNNTTSKYLLFTYNLEKWELHRNSILTWKVDLSILFTLKLFLIKILNIIISLCKVWKKITRPSCYFSLPIEFWTSIYYFFPTNEAFVLSRK